MKLNRWMIGIITAVVLLQVGVVYAYKTEVIVKAENKDDFATVVAAVHQQMQPGGRYEHVSASERTGIDQHFNDMQALFDKYTTVGQMDQNAKVQLFNDQEFVNATLTHRDNKRLVCEHIAPVGSHIPRTTCRTYGEIMREQRDTQDMLDKMHQVQAPTGGKG
ncbi:MAG TPA: hypothetical protein VFE77_13685 [Rhodanobacter sp.]|nr:hypothetical protein [Rhodanobacter sp.]